MLKPTEPKYISERPVNTHSNKNKYADDIRHLNLRLAKREGGRCVIGFALSEKEHKTEA